MKELKGYSLQYLLKMSFLFLCFKHKHTYKQTNKQTNKEALTTVVKA